MSALTIEEAKVALARLGSRYREGVIAALLTQRRKRETELAERTAVALTYKPVVRTSSGPPKWATAEGFRELVDFHHRLCQDEDEIIKALVEQP